MTAPATDPQAYGDEAIARQMARHPAMWIVPTVMTLVACTQIAISKTTLLTSWKGGGFGMFATTDQSFARHIKATGVTTGGRSVELRLRFTRDTDAVLPKARRDRVRTFPNEGDLRWIAGRLLVNRVVTNRASQRDVYRLPRPEDVGLPDERYTALRSVTLQMWQRHLDLTSLDIDAMDPADPKARRPPDFDRLMVEIRAAHPRLPLRFARVYCDHLTPMLTVDPERDAPGK